MLLVHHGIRNPVNHNLNSCFLSLSIAVNWAAVIFNTRTIKRINKPRKTTEKQTLKINKIATRGQYTPNGRPQSSQSDPAHFHSRKPSYLTLPGVRTSDRDTDVQYIHDIHKEGKLNPNKTSFNHLRPERETLENILADRSLEGSSPSPNI